MRLGIQVIALGATLAAGLAVVPRAEAIPAFARKYQFSCTTCHAPAPRLKTFGEDFAGRGFRMESAAKEPSRATYDVGDPLLKLPRDLPLAVRIEGFAAFKEGAAAKNDVEWPWVFKILSGGPINNRLSYYFYFLTEQGEVVGLEDAYVQYNSPFGVPVDVIFGQFQVCDPLFKRELRLERNDYDIFKTRVGDCVVNLAYDRGFVASWGAPADVDVVAQVVNGNGIRIAEDDSFDSDEYKNAALRLVRAFGPARVGAFGYWGRTKGENGRTNRTLYVGPDLAVDVGDRLAFSVEYLERRDDDPDFDGTAGSDWETRGGFVEAHYFPRGPDGRWILTALYSRVDSDDAAAKSEAISITGSYLLARNARLLVEPAYDVERERGYVSLGLITAF